MLEAKLTADMLGEELLAKVFPTEGGRGFYETHTPSPEAKLVTEEYIIKALINTLNWTPVSFDSNNQATVRIGWDVDARELQPVFYQVENVIVGGVVEKQWGEPTITLIACDLNDQSRCVINSHAKEAKHWRPAWLSAMHKRPKAA